MATLLTGLATTGANVFQSRVYPLAAAALPGLTVATLEEQTLEAATMGYPRQVDRELTVAVAAYGAANDALDDLLDDIASEVETALAADVTLGGLVQDCMLASTEIEMVREAAKPHGKMTMSWKVVYRIYENSPEVLI